MATDGGRAAVESAARKFVDQLTASPPSDAALNRAMRTIELLGEREVRATTETIARLSERWVGAVAGDLADRAPLARNIQATRNLATRLTGAKGNSAYPGAEIEALAKALDDDRATLMSDNARFEQVERALAHQIGGLERDVSIAIEIDALLSGRAEAFARTDLLMAVRQRRIQLSAQLAVATHALISVRMVTDSNEALIQMLRTAASTTVSALRTAGMAAETRQWADWVELLDEVDARRRTSLAGTKTVKR